MKGYMQVQMIGNLVDAPQERWAGFTDDTRKKLALFRLACSQDKEPTAYMECEAWGKVGENILTFTTKGTPLFIAGKLKCDRWEKGGKLNTHWKVVVGDARMLASPQRQGGYSGSRGAASVPPSGSAPGEIGYNKPKPDNEEDEDVPF